MLAKLVHNHINVFITCFSSKSPKQPRQRSGAKYWPRGTQHHPSKGLLPFKIPYGQSDNDKRAKTTLEESSMRTNLPHPFRKAAQQVDNPFSTEGHTLILKVLCRLRTLQILINIFATISKDAQTRIKPHQLQMFFFSFVFFFFFQVCTVGHTKLSS